MQRNKKPIFLSQVKKKIRGKRNKQLEAVMKTACPSVTVSGITAEGFWLHTPKKNYYISRKIFPWFSDATDKEIRDVCITLDVDEFHGDMLCWRRLDFDIGTNAIENTEWIKTKRINVRGVHRPDLED